MSRILAPGVDKNKLLMLGLNLLNKGLKLPCAVVQPQAKAPPAPKPTSQLVEKLKGSPQAEDVNGSRKRKRDPENDLSEVDKREKRLVFTYHLYTL